MINNWEETFARWSKPPSESEEERCSNAINMIKDALNNHPGLKTKNTTIILQGSFKNNTNIRKDSDIDICIRLNDVFLGQYPEGYTREQYGFSGADYTYTQYKNEVGEALRNKFGHDQVKRGNKAFAINSNSYRVKADVVAAFEHRRYYKPPNQYNNPYHSGIEFITDNGVRIINWPEQHYENGVNKNKATGRSFKRSVRIYKNLRNKMVEDGIASANNFPSFLIECLCWNVPNRKYSSTTYKEIISASMVYLFENAKEYNKCKEWGEVSELKYLFRPSQPWTHGQVNKFIYDAWNYVGFGE